MEHYCACLNALENYCACVNALENYCACVSAIEHYCACVDSVELYYACVEGNRNWAGEKYDSKNFMNFWLILFVFFLLRGPEIYSLLKKRDFCQGYVPLNNNSDPQIGEVHISRLDFYLAGVSSLFLLLQEPRVANPLSERFEFIILYNNFLHCFSIPMNPCSYWFGFIPIENAVWMNPSPDQFGLIFRRFSENEIDIFFGLT